MEIKGRSIEGFLKAPPRGLRLALIYGQDAGMVRERADALARRVVDDLTDPFRVADLTAGDLKGDPARLGDEAAAIAMMGGRRVVRVRDADHALAKIIEPFLEDPPGDALVVVEAGDIGKGALTRAVEGAGDTAASIACYPDEGEDLRGVIVSTLKASPPKVRPPKPKPPLVDELPEDDLRRLVVAGMKNQQSAYEALLAAGVVRPPMMDFAA